MTLEDIRATLGCEVLACEDKLSVDVMAAFGSDLMSDVLAFIKPGSLLLTGLVTQQSVRTADVADARAILYVRGKHPTDESIELAVEKGIPLLCTAFTMYEACGKLYAAGLPALRI